MPVDREMQRALVGELLEALRTSQNAADAVDEAASFSLGLNATDVRCVDIIERAGGVPAGRLAAETGLTTGAITAALDRLERAGLSSARAIADRRRVIVELTDSARVGE